VALLTNRYKTKPGEKNNQNLRKLRQFQYWHTGVETALNRADRKKNETVEIKFYAFPVMTFITMYIKIQYAQNLTFLIL